MDPKSNFRKSVLDLSPYNVSGHPAKTKLNQNESPFDIPADLKKAIVEEFLSISWNRYPDVFAVSLPRKLSKIFDLDEKSFIIANGSNELIYTIGLSIIERGTDVLIPQPTFYLFEKVAAILNANIIRVFDNSDLTFDENGILQHASRMKTGLIVIGSPNNPTGKSASRKFMDQLLRCTEAIVLVDEAYIDFSNEESIIGLTKSFKNLIVLRTFSKAFSLAGLRIGFLAAHPETAFEILKVKIPFTVNPLSEFTALRLLENHSFFEERISFLKAQKRMMADVLKGMEGVEVVESDANFFLFSTPFPAKQVFRELLEQQSVLIRDVSSYPLLTKYLRVNAGSKEESEIFVDSLRSCLKIGNKNSWLEAGRL